MIKLKLQYFWLPDVKSQLVGKDPKAGKDSRQEEEGTTEDEMDGGIIDSMNMNCTNSGKTVKDREAWHAAPMGLQRAEHD